MAPVEAPPVPYSRLVRERAGFRWLWCGGAVSALGDAIHLVALIWLATQTSAPGLNVAVVATSLYLPGVVLGPFAGAIADRFDRRRLLILADLSRIVTALAIPLAYSRSTIWVVAAASLVHTSVEALFNAARNAALPQVTGPDAVMAGNGLLSTTATAMSVAGAALSGLLLSTGEVVVPFAVNAATFAISATFVALLPRAPMAAPPRPAGITYLRSIRHGMRYAWVHPPVMVYMLIGAIATVGFAAAPVALPALLTDELGVGSVGFGLAQAVSAVGYTIGAVWTGRWITSGTGPLAMACGYLAVGLATLGLACTRLLWLALVLIAVRTAANAVSVVTGSSILQAMLPNDVRGRVCTLTGSVHEVPRLAILPVAGVVVDSWGARVVFVAMSLFICTAGIVAWSRRQMLAPDVVQDRP